MQSEKVYNLICQLSREEKSAFSNFAQTGTKYYALWKLLNNLGSHDSDFIMEKLDINRKDLGMLSDYLALQIIKSLTQNSGVNLDTIREAVARNLNTIAIKIGASEKKRFIQNEEFINLYQICSLERELRLDFKSEMGIDESFSLIQQSEWLAKSNELIRSNLFSSKIEREEIATRLEAELKRRVFNQKFSRIKIEYLKICTGIELLNRSFLKALFLQERLVNLLRNSQNIPPEFAIKEMATLTIMFYNQGFYLEAEKSFFKLRSMPTPSTSAELALRREIIGKGIHIALGSGDRGISDLIVSDFDHNSTLFSGSRLAHLMFYISQLELIHQNLGAAAKRINQVLAFPKKHIRERKWVYALLQAVIHFDIGNWDFLDYRTRMYRELARATKNNYVIFCFKVIYNLMEVAPSNRKKMAIELLPELESLIAENYISSKHFDFLTWLEAIAFDKSLSECLKTRWKETSIRMNQESL